MRSWRDYVQSVPCPLSVQWRHVASTPLPSAQAYPKRRCGAHQGDYKGKDGEREEQRKKHIGEASPDPPPQAVPADAMKSGVGKNSGGSSPVSGSSAPAPCSSSHSRTSSPDTALTTSSSTSAGARLPTSVEERKSSTARLHLPSARRSRTFHWPFHPGFPLHLRPQGLLLRLPLRALLREVVPGLSSVPAPPALRGCPIFPPVEVLPG